MFTLYIHIQNHHLDDRKFQTWSTWLEIPIWFHSFPYYLASFFRNTAPCESHILRCTGVGSWNPRFRNSEKDSCALTKTEMVPSVLSLLPFQNGKQTLTIYTRHSASTRHALESLGCNILTAKNGCIVKNSLSGKLCWQNNSIWTA